MTNLNVRRSLSCPHLKLWIWIPIGMTKFACKISLSSGKKLLTRTANMPHKPTVICFPFFCETCYYQIEHVNQSSDFVFTLTCLPFMQIPIGMMGFRWATIHMTNLNMCNICMPKFFAPTWNSQLDNFLKKMLTQICVANFYTLMQNSWSCLFLLEILDFTLQICMTNLNVCKNCMPNFFILTQGTNSYWNDLVKQQLAWPTWTWSKSAYHNF